ncbi:DJ-1/PfpI family protein [Burkholderia sp. Ac-20379]|uniref:DJ-1/PfpI family protein n=1 Tax=Burkholderia sp. Ac-20379 TaxID=2703900 RepID=UPI00197DF6C7|nr:DJ-1/PfpI family protein [Burkholderia sp. Ac-20379]MBN3726535.1 DJ-1/PfpI family protein [Burkholderia sp. Ac-20379]
MTDIHRRNALLMTLLSPLAVHSAIAQTPAGDRADAAANAAPDATPGAAPNLRTLHAEGHEEIAMLMYPGMTVIDLIGPHCMFGSLMGAKIHLVAKTLDPVTSDAGVTVVPTATFDTCPRDLTVLFTPGGTDGTLAAAQDPDILAFMRDRGARAKYVTSVCSGSLILGAAGLLTGYQATSHWSVRHVLAEYGAIPTEARVVHDRNRVTGAGVTSGLDFGLTMVAELRGRTYAECSQLVSEYDPEPPFNAGSLKTAPPDVATSMQRMLAGFTRQAEALAAKQTGRKPAA